MTPRLSRAAAEEFLQGLAGLLKAQGLYPRGHASVRRAEQALARAVQEIFDRAEPVLLGRADGYLVAGDVPFLGGNAHAAEVRRWLEGREIEGALLRDGVSGSDLARFCVWLRSGDGAPWEHPFIELTGLARGKENWQRALRVYRDAVGAMEEAYRDSREGRIPDATRALGCVRAFSDLLTESPGTLAGLVLIKDYDRYTFHHSVNVCLLSLGLARSLGLGRSAQESVGIGALLHDIGKTRTPPEVVRKPGRLTTAEWAEIRRHPEHGRDILAEMDGLPSAVAQVVFEHHMQADGGGYPSRNSGYVLCSLSPLVTVADVYDAMTTHRPYSTPRSLPDAVETLNRLRGSHFEPGALDAFVAMVGRVPVGSVVRLAAGGVGVVSRLGERGEVARIRMVVDRSGAALPQGGADTEVDPSQVVGNADPLAHGIDPAEVLRRPEK